MKSVTTIFGLLVVALSAIIGGIRSYSMTHPFLRDCFPFANPDFLSSSYRYTADDIPDLRDRVIIVTGGNKGLGYSTVKHLYQHQSTVVMTCRKLGDCHSAIKSIHEEVDKQSGGNIVPLVLDLSSLESVRSFCQNVLNKFPSVHHLILNAGIMGGGGQLTKDGIEAAFGINHVGHFYLVKLLLPIIKPWKKDSFPTVTTLTSLAHDSNCEEMLLTTLSYNGTTAEELVEAINVPIQNLEDKIYCRSKLANVLFSTGLARKYPHIFSNNVHPGVVVTPMAVEFFGPGSGLVLKLGTGFLFYHADQAALTQVYTAVAEEIQEKAITGQFFVPIARQSTANALGYDATTQDLLWDFTERVLSAKGF
eukprot:snap_masked-scaffold_2-processed-gene-21.8-mRNA-1 protein AED:0.31 eAED:0.31 QI:0/-1/0/1/-1/1/1/0/363